MQAYATCRILKNLGHNVEIINLHHKDLQNKSIMFKFFERIIREIYMRKFQKYFLPPLTKKYYSLKELQNDPPKSDCYLVGSDQVWNPNICNNSLLAFFLDFGNSEIRRVSYASSFGVKEWPITDININLHLSKLLNSFFAVSVREEEGRFICNKNFGIEPTVVLDPTLLHSDYNEITGEINSNQEIVCYKLNKTKDFFENISVVSRELKLPIRLLNSWRPIRGFKYNFPPSTKVWIKRIAGASFVVTDSFHGLAFSLIYQKQFVVILNEDGKNSRLENVLNKLDLNDRLFTSVKAMSDNLSWKNRIDYEIIGPKLQLLKQSSLNFLQNALHQND